MKSVPLSTLNRRSKMPYGILIFIALIAVGLVVYMWFDAQKLERKLLVQPELTTEYIGLGITHTTSVNVADSAERVTTQPK